MAKNFIHATVFKREHLDKRSQIFLLLHGWTLLLLPPIGTFIAIAIAYREGLGMMEVGLLLLMYALSIIGITVGLHRYFSHNSFQTNTAIRIILGVLGSMSAQGPLIYWVSNHRRHHQHSDQNEDPHSPYLEHQKLPNLKGLWHAHAGWILKHDLTNTFVYTKDLLKDPTMLKINQLYPLWVFSGIAFPTLLGGAIMGSWKGALLGFLWGGLVRIFLISHMAFSINSICHCYGKRPFNTKEQSTNNVWLAIPTGGEAWHNNHHAFPWSAKFGFRKWQIDLGYFFIYLLKIMGFVQNVKVPSPLALTKKLAKNSDIEDIRNEI